VSRVQDRPGRVVFGLEEIEHGAKHAGMPGHEPAHVFKQDGAAKVLPRSSAVMFLRWLPEHKTYVLLSQRSGYRQMKGAQIETGVGQVEALEAVEARLKQ
jgi:hypothetical protein